MNENEQLDQAIGLAVKAHAGQYDKAGMPYILHPLHLMSQLLYDAELAAIAVLHDAIEDSGGEVTAASLLNQGFSQRIVSALKLLTRTPEQNYLEDYIPKICTNYDAIRVKRKDLEHNSDITRLKGLSEVDFKRIEKYHKAFIVLGNAMRKFE